MKTQRIVICLLSMLLLGHLAFDFYFVYEYLYKLEDKTLKDVNVYSKKANSWSGGYRLVNTNNGKRSRSLQYIYSSNWWNKDSLIRFSEDLRIGFINSNTMEVVISPKFSIVHEFSEGFALAVSDSFPDKYGFINRKGMWQIRPKYDYNLVSGEDDTIHFTPFFHKGLCKIKLKDELYILVDTTGRAKTQSYRQIYCLMPGKYRIVKNSKDKYGLIDSLFRETIIPVCKSKEEILILYKRDILPKIKIQ